MMIYKRICDIALRMTSFTFIWWALVEGQEQTWWFGVPLILITTFISLRLVPDPVFTFSLRGLFSFIPFFLWQSLLGGIDVVMKALAPTLKLNPGFIEYHFLIPPDKSRAFLASTISLLPGSLSAKIEGDIMTVHVLDKTQNIYQSIQRAEYHIAKVMGHFQVAQTLKKNFSEVTKK